MLESRIEICVQAIGMGNLCFEKWARVRQLGWLSLGLGLGFVVNLGVLFRFRLCFYISDYTLEDCFCFPSCVKSLYNFRCNLADSAQL